MSNVGAVVVVPDTVLSTLLHQVVVVDSLELTSLFTKILHTNF
jgi:hypothetical protein